MPVPSADRPHDIDSGAAGGGRGCARAHVGAVPAGLDPAWVDAALTATGTATLRRRRLPAEQIVWLVLGMALYRDRSLAEVAAALDLALPGARGPTAAPSAVSQARTRLGPEPLAWLFTRCAETWAHPSADRYRWRGLALYGVDGTTLRVADTPANRAHFGEQIAGCGRGVSADPLVRVVALMALRSHLLAAVAFGPSPASAARYAAARWAPVPDASRTIVARNFRAAGTLLPLAAGGADRHGLVRAQSNTRMRPVTAFGEGDALVERDVRPYARRADPTLPTTWRARVIPYARAGTSQRLLTSLLDPVRYLAAEIVALYHERWELELGSDERKTALLERAESLRSQSPAAVTQALWGVLLAYNLVRLEMSRAAEAAHVAPTRLSFVGALHLSRDEWLWSTYAAPGAIPRHLAARLRDALARLVLPERRAERAYPRAVKRKMSNYPRKRPPPPPEPK